MWPWIEACTGWVAELNSWVCLGQFFLSCSVCDIGDNILKIHFVSWRGLYQPKVSREDGLPSPSSMCAHHSLSVFLARVVHLLHMMNLFGNIIFYPKAIVPFRIPGIRRMFSAPRRWASCRQVSEHLLWMGFTSPPLECLSIWQSFVFLQSLYFWYLWIVLLL